MQFTEIGFAIFLSFVFVIRWFILRNSVKGRNIMILAASYIFYGWWDWRFLTLIIATTLTTFLSAALSRRSHPKLWTTANIVLNLGILATFKYLGFFSENLRRLLSVFGWQLDWFTIDVLLPIGISFYTFQAIAYSVDVYKHRIPPCRDLLSFATFIAYFPQLVAGPIERAADLLPQLRRPNRWDASFAASGLRMILYGVFKKLCIVDMIALIVDRLYLSDLSHPLTTLIAGILFTLEIYCDFSAYSEIARGTSRLLGIELMANFRFPYFSRNIVEFWRRWHISLMMWFRDYLYIPLGGNRKGPRRTYINIAIVFLLSGLWHGAAWNFIMWGAYWAIVNIAGRAALHLRDSKQPIRFTDLPHIIITFFIVAFGFYIFRCSEWQQMADGIRNIWIYAAAAAAAWAIARVITSPLALRIASLPGFRPAIILLPLLLVTPLLWIYWQKALQLFWILSAFIALVIEWNQRNTPYPLSRVPSHTLPRWSLYWLLMLLVLLSEPVEMSFIYFQF